ncbi:PP2C family protein-serine/threonine phosphatase [Saccharothrix sp. ST-888]|uniref:PP2C family protein-serine/threonine phosphatase n=1 Tax=Saccharothrix sp. ST-888 TaxID=1427391 RepID=UPI0009E526F1|nr:PP2C family protein-serine/threonine phosphatase [Saccharothrix sp. ST-888]
MNTAEDRNLPRRASGLRALTPPRSVKPVMSFRGRDVSWVLPAVLFAVIALGDWNSSGEFRIVTWIVLVPGIAAAVCGPVITALFAAAAAIGYPELDNAWPHPDQMGPTDHALVVVGGAVAVLVSWLRIRAQNHLLRVESAADATRQVVLRPIPPGTGGLDVAGTYLAADSEARVGGDFFEVLGTPYGARALLGDVQGKGISAVSAASALVGTFREAGFHERDLVTVAERLESRMVRSNDYSAAMGRPDERFATAVLVSFPASADGSPPDWIELVNLGHEGPLAIGPDGVRVLPEGTHPPLGLGALVDGPPQSVRVPFGETDSLLMFTDGVSEARDRSGVFLPVRSRLAGTPGPDRLTVTELVALVERMVLDHTRGRLGDDTAILALRRLPGR